VTGKVHRYICVERSPFTLELNGFRAWLEVADYTPRVIRLHVRRLDQVLRELDSVPGATYTTKQLQVAFFRHNACPSQPIVFRVTQRHYQRYLASCGRLCVPVVPDRFAQLRDRYHLELVEVRGFALSTLRQRDATVSDFLNRGLRSRQALRRLTREDIERYVALKSKENSRQSLQHIVADRRQR